MWTFTKKKTFTEEECVWHTENDRIVCTKLDIEPVYDLEMGLKFLPYYKVSEALRKLVERTSRGTKTKF